MQNALQTVGIYCIASWHLRFKTTANEKQKCNFGCSHVVAKPTHNSLVLFLPPVGQKFFQDFSSVLEIDKLITSAINRNSY